MRQIDSSHRTPSRSQTAKSASIVVVDPDPLSLIAMAGVLHTQGYSCTCARNAEAARQALQTARQDLIVWDVADDAAAVVESLADFREILEYQQIAAVLLAEARWAGLETKAEAMSVPTRCLFKPIDANSLIAVVDNALWMPILVSAHRRKGSKPSRAGWVTL